MRAQKEGSEKERIESAGRRECESEQIKLSRLQLSREKISTGN